MNRKISTTIFLFTGILLAENTREIILPSANPVHVIRLLKTLLPYNPVILEAGAADGSDSILLSKTWPAGTIYSFEPVPELFDQLAKKVKSFTNIYSYQLALGDKNGFADFFLSEHSSNPGHASWSGSLLKPNDHWIYDGNVTFNGKIPVRVVTINTWTQKNNISRIDFLWLDLQGFELNVMKGASSIMPLVKAIYVEVEFVEAYAKQARFEEVDSWLKAQGFKRIARDFKLPPQVDGCWYGNCVYVRK